MDSITKDSGSREVEPSRGNAEILIFALVFMFLVSIAVLLPLFPNDFWPYVRIGREIVANGAVPTTEFMTYTQFGNPAVYLYWLPSLVFLGINNLGGVTLVGVFSVIWVGGFITLLWFCLREVRVGALTSAFVLLLTGLVGVNYWATRPQLLTYPLFGLALLAILRWQKGSNRLVWLLPLLAALWVNLHGGFIILFFLAVPALIFGTGNRKKLLLVILLSLVATFINRYGPGVWVNMFSMVNSTSIREFSVEWAAPLNDGWQANLFFATLLLLPALAAWRKPRIPLLYWVWFAGFGWMALSTVRYGVWFLPVLAILLGMHLAPLFAKYLEGRNRFQNLAFNRILGILLILFPLALLPGLRAAWWQQAPPIYSDTTPAAATDWLAAHPDLPGEVWSDFTFSTYLTDALPERKVFMTNRFEDFPPLQFDENDAIAKADADWQALLERFKIGVIMASQKYQPNLIAAAAQSDQWQEVYRDEMAVIFTRQPEGGAH